MQRVNQERLPLGIIHSFPNTMRKCQKYHSQAYKKQNNNATPSKDTPLTCIIVESLVPSAVLPTYGFVALGFPVEVETEVWVEAKFSKTGVPVAASVFVTVPTGLEVVFQTVKL